MGHEGQETLIKDILVFLFAAGVLVPLSRLARIPAVLGFIFAGVALGPSGLGALAERWPALAWVTQVQRRWLSAPEDRLDDLRCLQG